MPQGRGRSCNGFSLRTTGGNCGCNTALLGTGCSWCSLRKASNNFRVWTCPLQLFACYEVKRLENYSCPVMPDTVEYPKRTAGRFLDSRIGVSQRFLQGLLEDLQTACRLYMRSRSCPVYLDIVDDVRHHECSRLHCLVLQGVPKEREKKPGMC